VARVFISYGRLEPDTGLARAVHQALAADGHQVFRDEDMEVGTLWGERIDDELQRADVLVALLSEASAQRDMVRGEIDKAVRLKKRILPVRLAYRAPFAYPLSAWVDPHNHGYWDGPQDTSKVVEALRRAVAAAGPPASPASPPSAKAPPPEDDKQYVARLQRLRAEIEATLRGSPPLVRALAEKLGLEAAEPGADQVAAALLEAKGAEVARVLRRLDADASQDRRCVRELLWRILPMVADWSSAVEQARAAFSTGGTSLELPLRSETIAALVMAGADGRPAELDPVSARGKGQVSPPAAWYAPVFPNRQELLDSFVVALGAQGGPTASVWADVKKTWNDPAELRIAVAAQLKELADPGSPDWLPHYLLYVDQAMAPRAGQGGAGAFWRVVQDALGSEFPALRLVRLTGGPEQLRAEIDVVTQIRALLRASG
jgi:hypothetical protein